MLQTWELQISLLNFFVAGKGTDTHSRMYKNQATFVTEKGGDPMTFKSWLWALPPIHFNKYWFKYYQYHKNNVNRITSKVQPLVDIINRNVKILEDFINL